MSILGHPGSCVRHSAWRSLLILLAVLSLTLSLAGRYTSVSSVDFGKTTSIATDSTTAKTQHLLSDGLQWTAPVTAILMLVVPRRAARIVHAPLPVIDLYAEDWLYNRPPPSC